MLHKYLPGVLILSLLVLSFSAAAPADQAVYRWTDADGLVHYGRRPPGEVDARRIQMPSSTDDRVSDDEAAGRRERRQRLLQDYNYRRERKKEAAMQDARQRQARDERCRSLRRYWRQLSFAGPIYHRRADGGRDFLSDEQRAAEKARLRPAMLAACGEAPQ